jgi:hypothetical protein
MVDVMARRPAGGQAVHELLHLVPPVGPPCFSPVRVIRAPASSQRAARGKVKAAGKSGVK